MSREGDWAGLGRARRPWEPGRGEAHLAGQEVHLGDSGCVSVQASELHTRCAVAKCTGSRAEAGTGDPPFREPFQQAPARPALQRPEGTPP